MRPLIFGTALTAALAAVALAGCGAASVAPAGTPSVTGSPATSSPAADAAGLVQAQHPACNLGPQILRYLASGDNGGNPGLDQAYAKYAGVPIPQARGIADDAIQSCDADLSRQEAAAASASASAAAQRAKESEAAQVQAQAQASKAALVAVEQKNCAAIGGRVRDGGMFADLCVSTSPGHTTDGSNTSCSYGLIAFQPDGSLAATDVAEANRGYPGCFGKTS